MFLYILHVNQKFFQQQQQQKTDEIQKRYKFYLIISFYAAIPSKIVKRIKINRKRYILKVVVVMCVLIAA